MKFPQFLLFPLYIFPALLAGCVSVALQEQLDAKLAEGKYLYAEKRCGKALGIFQDIVNTDPKRIDGHTWLSRCLVEDGHLDSFSKAIEHGKIAYNLALSSDHPKMKQYLDDILARGASELKKGSSGLLFFRLYLFSQPVTYKSYLDVGGVRAKHGECEDSLSDLYTASKLGFDSRFPRRMSDHDRAVLLQAFRSCGEQMISKGKLGVAIPHLEQFVEIEINDSNVCALLDWTYVELKIPIESSGAYVRGLCPLPQVP